MLQDDETFKVTLLNPVYSHLEIKLLSDIEAVDYINEYKNADWRVELRKLSSVAK